MYKLDHEALWCQVYFQNHSWVCPSFCFLHKLESDKENTGCWYVITDFIWINWFLLKALWLSVVYCFPLTTWSILLLAEKNQYQFKPDSVSWVLGIQRKKYIFSNLHDLNPHVPQDSLQWNDMNSGLSLQTPALDHSAHFS